MIYVIASIFFQSLSLLFNKYAAISGSGIDRYLNVWVVLSFGSMGFQALVWQQALKRIKLSIAYPMMSIVLIVIPALSYFFFDDKISLIQAIGILLIMLGVIQITKGSTGSEVD